MNHKNCVISYFRGVTLAQKVCDLGTSNSTWWQDYKNRYRVPCFLCSLCDAWRAAALSLTDGGPEEPEAAAAAAAAMVEHSHKTQQCSTSLHSCALDQKCCETVTLSQITFHFTALWVAALFSLTLLLFIFHLFSSLEHRCSLWLRGGGAAYKCCL